MCASLSGCQSEDGSKVAEIRGAIRKNNGQLKERSAHTLKASIRLTFQSKRRGGEERRIETQDFESRTGSKMLMLQTEFNQSC